jgi:putative endonuclease
MPRDHQYFVYVLASRSRTLYIGVTSDLVTHCLQHRAAKPDSFTARYGIHRLVYFERFSYIDKAIAREKYLKHCTRAEKIALIQAGNPTWEDLSRVRLQYDWSLEADPPPAAKDDNS